MERSAPLCPAPLLCMSKCGGGERVQRRESELPRKNVALLIHHENLIIYRCRQALAAELEGSEVRNAAAAAVLATEWTRDAWLPMCLFR